MLSRAASLEAVPELQMSPVRSCAVDSKMIGTWRRSSISDIVGCICTNRLPQQKAFYHLLDSEITDPCSTSDPTLGEILMGCNTIASGLIGLKVALGPMIVLQLIAVVLVVVGLQARRYM